MKLSKEQFIERYAEQSMQWTRNTLTPKEYEWPCIAYTCKLIKNKIEFSEFWKKIVISIND